MRMSGGEAIVAALAEHGVDTVFGLPGVQTYPIFDGLAKRAGAIRTIGARHEQATAYMAFGYAQATGRPGVYCVVPGPGVLNTLAALSTAWGCSLPVLCVTGQTPRAFLEAKRGHLHEIPDQLGAAGRFCNYASRIERAEDAPRIVAEAFRAMLSGRPGPALIEMCWDDLAKEGEAEPFALLPLAPPPAPDAGAIAEAARLARAAKRPMIAVGTGARHAGPEVLALAEALGAPVVSHRGGRGIAPSDHPLALSSYAARTLWEETDLLIGIGSRLEMPYMRWSGMGTRIVEPEAPPHLIRIDIDPDEMGRLVPHVGIVADAAAGAEALRAALEGHEPAGRERLQQARARAAQAIAEVRPHVGHLEALRRALPREGIFVDELTQAGYAAFFAWDVFAPRTYVTSGFQGNLGYGFMTALGVKAARPELPVLSITGDGGFLYGASEMATATREGLNVTVVLFDNGAYGNVKRDQMRLYEGRAFASDFDNPDFELLARAYGWRYARAEGAEALEAAAREGLAAEGPTLVHVPVRLEDEVSPWPLIIKG